MNLIYIGAVGLAFISTLFVAPSDSVSGGAATQNKIEAPKVNQPSWASPSQPMTTSQKNASVSSSQFTSQPPPLTSDLVTSSNKSTTQSPSIDAIQGKRATAPSITNKPEQWSSTSHSGVGGGQSTNQWTTSTPVSTTTSQPIPGETSTQSIEAPLPKKRPEATIPSEEGADFASGLLSKFLVPTTEPPTTWSSNVTTWTTEMVLNSMTTKSTESGKSTEAQGFLAALLS